MFNFLLIIEILVCILLVVTVLLQAGTGGGLAAMGGGASTDTFLGGRQAATILTKATWWLGGLFLGLALILAGISTQTSVPRSVLENPQQAQALLFTLNVKSVELELDNDGGVQTALALYAQMIGSGEDALKQQLLLQLGAMLGQVGNDAFARQVSAAAEAFMNNPQNLSIRAAPSAPVPVAQIMSDAMAAPDALPERLGITVEANR